MTRFSFCVCCPVCLQDVKSRGDALVVAPDAAVMQSLQQCLSRLTCVSQAVDALCFRTQLSSLTAIVRALDTLGVASMLTTTAAADAPVGDRDTDAAAAAALPAVELLRSFESAGAKWTEGALAALCSSEPPTTDGRGRSAAALRRLLEEHGSLECDSDAAVLVESEFGVLATPTSSDAAADWPLLSDPEVGQLCWVKFRGLPYWPARVENPFDSDATDDARLRGDAGDVDVEDTRDVSDDNPVLLVRLFGSEVGRSAWCAATKVCAWRRAAARDSKKGAAPSGDGAAAVEHPNVWVTKPCALFDAALREATEWAATAASGVASVSATPMSKKRRPQLLQQPSQVFGRKRTRLGPGGPDGDGAEVTAADRLQV
jgi:hypothetical protein